MIPCRLTPSGRPRACAGRRPLRRAASSRGVGLVELLVALMIASIFLGGALHFYTAQHRAALVQRDVSDMQQNVRASLDEIVHRLRNCGANLPDGLPALVSRNTNPDTIVMRSAPLLGLIAVGDHTQKNKASPIHVDPGLDLSAFVPGTRAYIWYNDVGVGEWFDITKVSVNAGAGWTEIHHQTKDLMFDPKPGHSVMALREARFFIDATDTTHPVLMRALDGLPPEPFADNIDDLQFRYVRAGGDTVDVIAPTDTVFVVQVALRAHTERPDEAAKKAGADAYRRRLLQTEVVLRNIRF